MDLESNVTLGPQIPMPVKNVIDRAIREACDSWLHRNVVSPNERVFRTGRSRKKETLSDDDLLYATLAAQEAARRC